jgi:hypothetical protein
MATVALLRVGSTVSYDGGIWSLVSIQSGLVQLRDSRGASALFRLSDLISSEGFKLLDEPADDSAGTATFFDALPEHEQRRARAKEAHIHEARTGYRSGSSEKALRHEPRKQYDPALTSQEQRWEAKARELRRHTSDKLNLSARRLRELASAYDKVGVWGLVDRRVIRTLVNPVNPEVEKAIRAAIDDNADQSNLSRESFRKIVRARLDAEHGDGVVPLPKRTRFNELLDQFARGRGIFGWAKTKRSIKNAPPRPYGRLTTTRLGEIVEFDHTVLDVFAVHPITFEPVQVELSAAFDKHTHLVTPRTTAYSTKGLDASMLLFDLLHPKRRGIGHGSGSLLPYLGIPSQIILVRGGVPSLLPESVTIDNGRVYRSEVFENACRRLGITIRYARPYRPTDKAHVERWFRTIRHDLLELLPGYKGPGLYERGRAVEKDAFYFLDEIDSVIYDYVAEVYNVRRQDGLHLPERPGLPMSPLDMYEESLSRVGSVPIPSDPTLYYELLPRVWRVVNHYGVEVGGLIYDDECLNDYRNRRSSFNGREPGKWPFQVDPGDRSEIYFRDGESGVWRAVPWAGNRAATDPRPFSEETVAYAKKLLLARDIKRANHEELTFVINELLDRLAAQVAAESSEERRAFAREQMARQRQGADTRRPRLTKQATESTDEAVLSEPVELPGSPAGSASPLAAAQSQSEPEWENEPESAFDLFDIRPMPVLSDEVLGLDEEGESDEQAA